MARIKTLFFATVRDRAGVRSIDLELPAQTSIAALKSLLSEEFPLLKGYMGYMLTSLNGEFVSDDALIPDGAEIALFPPVSGG